jgi:hypothetical protein
VPPVETFVSSANAAAVRVRKLMFISMQLGPGWPAPEHLAFPKTCSRR